MNRRTFLALPAIVPAVRAAHARPRLLIVGNSITTHAPAPWLGWTGSWGMAASAPERDYAHIVAERLGAELVTHSAVQWELDYTAAPARAADAAGADVAVVRIGDNVQGEAYDEAAYRAAYRVLLASIAPAASTLVCTSTWYPRTFSINDVMRDECARVGGRWVRIDDLSERWENHASYERFFPNTTVGTHPGDLGMQRIAERVLDGIAGRVTVAPVASCLAFPLMAR